MINILKNVFKNAEEWVYKISCRISILNILKKKILQIILYILKNEYVKYAEKYVKYITEYHEPV